MHDVQPAALAARVASNPGRVNHTAFVSADPVQERARLAEMGTPVFLLLRKGHVEVTWHDGPDLGHAVEVHRSSPELIALNDGFAQAARDWDGSEPLRPMPTPAYVS
jgi:hypothetical protein